MREFLGIGLFRSQRFKLRQGFVEFALLRQALGLRKRGVRREGLLRLLSFDFSLAGGSWEQEGKKQESAQKPRSKAESAMKKYGQHGRPPARESSPVCRADAFAPRGTGHLSVTAWDP